MALQLDAFSRTRPFLYHLTARENLASIGLERLIRPSIDLLPEPEVEARRLSHVAVRNGTHTILVRDQRPLHAGNVAFAPGWDLPRLVRLLNEHVFFWPGTEAGPNEYGWRHFKRYESERPILLRVSLDAVVRTNLRSGPFFSRFNSGAPRSRAGRKSPRGDATFVSARHFQGTPCEVVEVVFRGVVALPREIDVAKDPGGPWESIE